MDAPHAFDRRTFLGLAAASTFTLVPRHVLGGPGHIAPSDKVNLALIGSGTMALHLLVREWLACEDLHFTCVCDPNRDSTDYRDWSPFGLRNSIRAFLDDPNWGEGDAGIRAGREVGREVIERHYGRSRPAGYTGCRTYADFRELLAAEDDLDGVVIMTPEHLHATIAIAALNAGKHAITHKTLSNVLHEVRLAAEAARRSGLVTHLLAWNNDPDLYLIRDLIQAGAIGTVREVHNWSNRPAWPQGWLDYPEAQPPVPEGLDWDLWLGPVPHRPYHPLYTHMLFRGWYDFGSGCLGDMGNYSLWRVYRILGLDTPVSVTATPSHDALVEHAVSRRKWTEVAFPHASTIRFRHAAQGDRPALDVWWYDGSIKPPCPTELYDIGEELPQEGMLFVGDDGKILGDFRGREPRLLSSAGPAPPPRGPAPEETTEALDEWVGAIKNGTVSRGSFQEAQAIAEATCLGNLSIRMNRRLDWDAEAVAVTNVPEANRYLRRDYRAGWEL